MTTSLRLPVALSVTIAAVLSLGILAPGLPAAAAPKPATKAAPAKPAAKPAATNAAAKPTEEAADTAVYNQVYPLDLLKEPGKYLDKNVEFTGTFNRFSDTGLDYKKAFRDSRDYVSLFILRPNVEPKTIPLAELKLFFPRKKSDDVMNLESGDVIRVRGKVFSTALNESWVDITNVKILQKTKDSTKKPAEEL